MDQSELLPLPADEWDPQIAHLSDGFAGRLNVYRVMAHNPPLLAAWAELRDHLVAGNALGPELSEIAILRIGHRVDSEYEQAHHIVRARACGISDARIRQTLAAGVPDDPTDARIVMAIDELAATTRISGPTLESLMTTVGRRGVLDLIALFGFYVTLGGILKTFGTPIDAEIVEALDRSPLTAGMAL
ncbi:carboxymuconolactone decarboxylase family protein [Aquibium oceanicum]|uniref:Carboxymuconolactone decarboxylase-like domain-containing protein n=1 Tax=Aquibium oceanicum TaxID=1670800 RepID=A0A1L3SQH8_9HYPH|nr:carboxymuconolactone decarboxylase family protein [Aquibium oceanicum]APH71649.1 hypothetical protein BSQ44_09930 [Aquibium oceanicum]